MDIMKEKEVIKLYNRNIKRSRSFLYNVDDSSKSNSGSVPLKNSLNNIKEFKIKKKMNPKITKFIFFAKRLSDKEFSFC